MEVEDSIATGANPVQQYLAKYLTIQNLLDLQLGDLRRYVLIQFLIMFQYLKAPVKFKQYGNKSIIFGAARVYKFRFVWQGNSETQ
jgi:THO complex subunit 1 transcription elongation factor